MNGDDAFDLALCAAIVKLPQEVNTLLSALNLMRRYMTAARIISLSMDRLGIRLTQLDILDREVLNELGCLTQ